MKPPLSLVVLLFIASSAIAQQSSPSPSPPPQMYVPDGQILADPVRVSVAFANLDKTMKPRLRDGRTNISNQKEWEPFLVAPNQTWTEKVAGQSVERHGTLLMFDLSQFEIEWFKSTTRVTPVLSWQSPDAGNPQPILVGQSVYLGQRWVALGWTALTLVILTVLFVWMAKKAISSIRNEEAKSAMKGVRVFYLLAGPDNYMSLWRTQLAAWTIAVGGMVFMFGLIQFDVPRIPETLVALMGLSVATGGLSALATKSQSGDATGKSRSPNPTAPITDPFSTVAPNPPSVSASGATAPARQPTDKPRWFHLISSYSEDAASKMVLSVSKAQMVSWTGIILVLFVVKSILRGELWEVPWELVTLTGVSQAGYVTDKAVERAKENQAAQQRGREP